MMESERFYSLSRSRGCFYASTGAALETGSIVSVLKKGALWAIMIGVPAALGVYDITGLLREMARRNLAVLWSEAEKELQENLREAVQDLRRAQERKWMSECGEL